MPDRRHMLRCMTALHIWSCTISAAQAAQLPAYPGGNLLSKAGDTGAICRPDNSRPCARLSTSLQIAAAVRWQPRTAFLPGLPVAMGSVSQPAQLSVALPIASAPQEPEPETSAPDLAGRTGAEAAVVLEGLVMCLTARQLQALLGAVAGLQAEAARGFSQPVPRASFSTSQTADSAQQPWVSAVCVSVPCITYQQITAVAAAAAGQGQLAGQEALTGPQLSVPELMAAVICTTAGAWRPVAAVQLTNLQLAASPQPSLQLSALQLHTGAMPASAAAAVCGTSSTHMPSAAVQHVRDCLEQPPAAIVSDISLQPLGASQDPAALLTMAVHAASLAARLSPRSMAHLAALGMAASSGGPALPPVPLIPPAHLKSGPEIKVRPHTGYRTSGPAHADTLACSALAHVGMSDNLLTPATSCMGDMLV